MYEIYVFSSEWTEHIAIAARECIWKVRSKQVPQLLGKARDNVSPGDFGCFYDSQEHRLTVPFVFASEVGGTDSDMPFPKGGPYHIEFRLFPLGPMSRGINLADLAPGLRGAVSPALLFVRTDLNREQWIQLVEALTPIPAGDLARSGWDLPFERFLRLKLTT